MVQTFQEAVLLHRQGRLREAAAAYQQVLRINSRHVDALHFLGLACCQLGAHAEGIRHLRKCLKLKPDLAVAHGNLGEALRESGDRNGALQSLRRAVALDPKLAEAHANLGYLLHELERYDEAVASYQRALAVAPEHPATHNHLGNTFLRIGKAAEAETCFRRALELAPDFVAACNNLGVVLKSQLRVDEAEACFRRAIEVDPAYAPAYGNLASIVCKKGALGDAEKYSRMALELVPNYALAHINLADALRHQGRYSEAEEHCLAALRLNPLNFEAYQATLFLYSFLGGDAAVKSLAVARQCGEMLSRQTRRPYVTWLADPAPERLRVGFVSGDLRSHPVGFFLETILRHLDAKRIELIGYPTTPTEDELTCRIKPHFSDWKPLVGISDVEAAERIRADGVHVLVDLSGYTAATILPVFAIRPAPVQASWLGYFATTGLAQMDYLLADAVGVPSGKQDQFSETIWYLPDTRLCFSPPATNIEVAALPTSKKGFITFGCFQNLGKIGDDVLAAWSKILSLLPDARLRLQAKQFTDSSLKEGFLARCGRLGIDAARVDLHGDSLRAEYLAAYAEVDIVLDTFPYPGGTTTCEALWMGVPTVTLAGDTLLSRQGASLLTAAGLGDWVAGGEAEYVAKALAFAGDTEALAALRGGLRTHVLASPLFDAPRFARNLEAALWGMWEAKRPR